MSIGQRKYPRDELVTSIIMPDSPISRNKSQILPQQPKIEPIRQNGPVSPSYNYEPYLYDELKKSEKQTTFAQRQLIQQQMELLETKVHDIEGGEDQGTALANIYKNSLGGNPHIDDGIQNIVKKATDNIASGLTQKVKPLRTIPKTKEDIKELQKVDKYRLLKIKNGEIKNKVGDLRNELQKEYYAKKANFKLPDHENIKESDYYSMNNPRTQQANEFVHQVQRKRNEEKQKYLEYLQQKREEEEYRKEYELQRKKAEAEERKMRLEEIYKEKKLKRLMEEEQHMKKKEEYKNWSKIFSKEKPLFLKKEQEFIEKSLIPELYNRRDRLLEIKMERRPIDINSINDHDERYMEYKRDDSIRAQAQLEEQKEKMQMQEEELRHLYKGKYRYIALEEMMNERMKQSEDPRDLEREKKARQIVYADEIKQRLHQEIKLKQLQTLNLEKKEFTKRTRKIDGSTSVDLNDETKMSSFTDPKADGKKNLYYLKELIRQKGIKKDRPIIRLIEQKNTYPDYLEQMHDKRRKSLNLQSSKILEEPIDSSKGSPKLESLVSRERYLTQKVKRAELRKKYNSVDYKEDASIEENELDAVRLKMKLISQVN